MEFIYTNLQPKYIAPYNTKQHKMSIKKRTIGIKETEYPRIPNLSPSKAESDYNRFSNAYKVFFKKDNTTLPKLLSINESLDILQNRNCTFTDPRYPKYFKNNLSKINKRKHSLNIIESLDDPDLMKCFHESSYDSFINKNTPSSDNKPLIDMLMQKISLVDYSQSHMKTHQYSIATADITLKLKGLSLALKDPKSKGKASVKLHLPLSLIPFYLSISHQSFLFFLAKIIKLPMSQDENIDFSSISLDMGFLKSYVSDFVSEDKLFSQDSIFINVERYNECQMPMKYCWLIHNKELELEIQPIMIELKAILAPHSSLTGTITQETERKLIIRKAISKQLMCFLIQTSYLNWERPAMCYLSSFKLFRKVISYAYGRPMPTNHLTVFIDEVNESHIKAPNGGKASMKGHPINNSKSSFSFFMTLKSSSFFFTFHSYKVSLVIDSFKRKQFDFDIPFDKMRFLYQLNTKHNIEDIIRKCIIVNKANETVSCSVELLKGIAFESMEKFFESKDELNALKSTLKVTLPRIEWEEMVNIYSTRLKERKDQRYFLKDCIVDKLLIVEKSKWPDIFSQFQEEFVKDIETKVNRAKRHVQTFKRDLPLNCIDSNDCEAKSHKMKALCLHK